MIWLEYIWCMMMLLICLMFCGGVFDGFLFIGGVLVVCDIVCDVCEGWCVVFSVSWDGFKRERDDERDAGGDVCILYCCEVKLFLMFVCGDVMMFVWVVMDVVVVDFVCCFLIGEVFGVGVRFFVVFGGEDVFVYLFFS